MNALDIITLASVLLGVAVSITVLITFGRNSKKDIKSETKETTAESTAYAVNQQHIINDLKEIKVQLTSISQKNDTNFQMAIKQEERQNQADKRLDKLEAKIEQVYMLINSQGGIQS